MKYSYKNMQESLKNNEFSFKKKYGQNFIIDENIINNIIKNAEIDEDTLVLEIGPGAGSLTSKLGQVSKKVIAYEIDETVKDILEKNINKETTTIIYDDFLKRDVEKDLKKIKYKKIYVVANLPYYITTPIIMRLITLNVDKILIMVQKEVGNRFSAKPKTKEYNSLSVYLNYYFNIEKVLNVSRNVFLPKPNVDSIVVKLTKKEKLHLKDEKLFFNIVRDSFTQKRKTIKNNLKKYNLNTIEETLKKYNLDLSVRAEALSLEIFVDIANNLSY